MSEHRTRYLGLNDNNSIVILAVVQYYVASIKEEPNLTY